MDNYFLQEWIEREINSEDAEPLFTLGAMLPTRDGRRVGNAIVIDVCERFNNRCAVVVTDAGNRIILSECEMNELFHAPLFVQTQAIVDTLRSKHLPLEQVEPVTE